MADELSFAETLPPRARFAPRLSEVGLFAFLLLIFVGIEPFAVRDPTVLTGAQSATSGAGDLIRQVCYASVFALTVFSALHEKGLSAFRVVPPVLVLLLLWCLTSAFWSPEPGVTLRRAALEAVIVLSAMVGVATVGATRSLDLLRWVLLAVLVVNWLSIPLVHQAVHLPGDPEPQLVGDWRGLYFHKNIAGAVSALTALLFFFSAWDRRKAFDAFVCLAAVGFAIMTRSKSSLLLLPVALAAGAVYKLAWRSTLDRAIVLVAFGLVAMGVSVFALADQHILARLFASPEGFTGRTEIWQAELAFIHDHPYLGAGFGSFSDTGTFSPLHNYIASSWVNAVAHGHNAYLQLFVTIGGVGFVLTVLGLVVMPLVTFLRAHQEHVRELALPFAVFVFMVLHNFLESDFLEGDGQAWVAFLLVLAVVRLMPRGQEEPDAEPAWH